MLKGTAVSGGKNIADKEGSVQGRELGSGTANQDLTHSRRQMGDGGLVVSHPFCKFLMGNVLLGRAEELCSQKKRCENVSLDRIVGNAGRRVNLLSEDKLKVSAIQGNYLQRL